MKKLAGFSVNVAVDQAASELYGVFDLIERSTFKARAMQLYKLQDCEKKPVVLRVSPLLDVTTEIAIHFQAGEQVSPFIINGEQAPLAGSGLSES